MLRQFYQVKAREDAVVTPEIEIRSTKRGRREAEDQGPDPPDEDEAVEAAEEM